MHDAPHARSPARAIGFAALSGFLLLSACEPAPADRGDAERTDGRSRRVYASGIGGRVLNVIDAALMERVAQIDVGQGPHGVRTSADGDSVYVAVSGDQEIVVVDAATRTVARRIPMGGTPFWIAVPMR